jgi:hypothetical protein
MVLPAAHHSDVLHFVTFNFKIITFNFEKFISNYKIFVQADRKAKCYADSERNNR